MLVLHHGALTAAINPRNQQLVSLQKNGVEYMHGGGKPENERDPGWPNSEIIMFPIVGPALDGKIHTPKGTIPMGQHGIVRYLPFTLTHATQNEATYTLHYAANDAVPTPKGETPWPYSFSIEKKYTLTDNGLEFLARVTNESGEPMPYMFGWHPAFRFDSLNQTLNELPLAIVRQAQPAVIVASNYVSTRGLSVRSNCSHTMLWCPSEGQLFCIEPVSHPAVFSGIREPAGVLAPHESKLYTVNISLE
jgi:galactose mutarotase-like enzyme